MATEKGIEVTSNVMELTTIIHRWPLHLLEDSSTMLLRPLNDLIENADTAILGPINEYDATTSFRALRFLSTHLALLKGFGITLVDIDRAQEILEYLDRELRASLEASVAGAESHHAESDGVAQQSDFQTE